MRTILTLSESSSCRSGFVGNIVMASEHPVRSTAHINNLRIIKAPGNRNHKSYPKFSGPLCWFPNTGSVRFQLGIWINLRFGTDFGLFATNGSRRLSAHSHIVATTTSLPAHREGRSTRAIQPAGTCRNPPPKRPENRRPITAWRSSLRLTLIDTPKRRMSKRRWAYLKAVLYCVPDVVICMVSEIPSRIDEINDR